MKVFYANINRINEDVESFVIAKNKIEKIFIAEEKIENKQSIKDFLNLVEINKVFVASTSESMQTVAFTIYNDQETNDVILLISSTSDKAVDEFKEIMKLINYDLSQLVHYNTIEMALDAMSNNPYFIINNEFYLVKQKINNK